MRVLPLYAAVVLIWGSTWSVIRFQIGPVAEEVSVAASYLALIRRIGSARAAYTSVLFPVVALSLSTFIEGYRWTTPAVVGILLTMGGNWLALSRARPRRRPAAAPGNPTI